LASSKKVRLYICHLTCNAEPSPGSATYNNIGINFTHELVEQLTDPNIDFNTGAAQAWIDNTVSPGQELCDECEQYSNFSYQDTDVTDTGGQLDVAAYYSNRAAACVIPGLLSSGGVGMGFGTGTHNKYGDGGGGVIANGKVYLIFWGSDWLTRTADPTMSGVLHRIRDLHFGQNANTYYGELNQYNVGVPQWGGYAVNQITAVPSGNAYTNSQMIQVVVDSINNGLVPPPAGTSTNYVYLVLAPAAVTQGPNGTFANHGMVDTMVTSPGTLVPPPSPGGKGAGADFYSIDQTSPPIAVALHSGSTTRFGEASAIGSTNLFVGNVIKKATVYLRKHGSPTGSISCTLRHDDDTVFATASNTIDPSTLTTTFDTYDFSFTANTTAIGDGLEKLVVEYYGGNSSNYVEIQDNDGVDQNFDGPNVCSISSTATTSAADTTHYTTIPTHDICGIFYNDQGTGPSPSPGPSPPPGPSPSPTPCGGTPIKIYYAWMATNNTNPGTTTDPQGYITREIVDTVTNPEHDGYTSTTWCTGTKSSGCQIAEKCFESNGPGNYSTDLPSNTWGSPYYSNKDGACMNFGLGTATSAPTTLFTKGATGKVLTNVLLEYVFFGPNWPPFPNLDPPYPPGSSDDILEGLLNLESYTPYYSGLKQYNVNMIQSDETMFNNVTTLPAIFNDSDIQQCLTDVFNGTTNGIAAQFDPTLATTLDPSDYPVSQATTATYLFVVIVDSTATHISGAKSGHGTYMYTPPPQGGAPPPCPGPPSPGGGIETIYDVPDPGTGSVHLFNGGTTRFGALNHSSPGSVLLNQTINSVKVWMKTVGSPAGNVTATVRYDDDTIVQNCSASIAVSSITSTIASYTFNFNSPLFNFPDEGVSVLIEYNDPSSNSSNYISVEESPTDAIDGSATCSVYYAGTYTFDTTKDLVGTITALTTPSPSPGPAPAPTPTPGPSPGTGTTDANGVRKLYPDATGTQFYCDMSLSDPRSSSHFDVDGINSGVSISRQTRSIAGDPLVFYHCGTSPVNYNSGGSGRTLRIGIYPGAGKGHSQINTWKSKPDFIYDEAGIRNHEITVYVRGVNSLSSGTHHSCALKVCGGRNDAGRSLVETVYPISSSDHVRANWNYEHFPYVAVKNVTEYFTGDWFRDGKWVGLKSVRKVAADRSHAVFELWVDTDPFDASTGAPKNNWRLKGHWDDHGTSGYNNIPCTWKSQVDKLRCDGMNNIDWCYFSDREIDPNATTANTYPIDSGSTKTFPDGTEFDYNNSFSSGVPANINAIKDTITINSDTGSQLPTDQDVTTTGLGITYGDYSGFLELDLVTVSAAADGLFASAMGGSQLDQFSLPITTGHSYTREIILGSDVTFKVTDNTASTSETHHHPLPSSTTSKDINEFIGWIGATPFALRYDVTISSWQYSTNGGSTYTTVPTGSLSVSTDGRWTDVYPLDTFHLSGAPPSPAPAPAPTPSPPSDQCGVPSGPPTPSPGPGPSPPPPPSPVPGGTGTTDAFGVTKLFPSNPSGSSWIMQPVPNITNLNDDVTPGTGFDNGVTGASSPDPNSDPRSLSGGFKPHFTDNGDGSWKVKMSEMRWDLTQDNGFSESSLVLDQSKLPSRGYMQDPKDWKNVEITCFMKVNSASSSTHNGEAHPELVTGGARQTSETSTLNGFAKSCEASSYHFNFYPLTGRTKYEKDLQHTNGYTANSQDPQINSNTRKWADKTWVGLKAVKYVNSDGQSVHLESWFSSDGSPTGWKKVMSFDDTGHWGGGSPHCGGTDHTVITWAGPIIGIRTDNIGDCDFKWASIREINPFSTTGNTIPASVDAVVGLDTCPPPPSPGPGPSPSPGPAPPPSPTPETGDKFGIQKIYPDKADGSQSWFMDMNNGVTHKSGGGDPATIVSSESSISEVKNSDGTFHLSGLNDGSIAVSGWGKQTAGSSQFATMNQSEVATRGYILNTNDMKNLEITAFVQITGVASSQSRAAFFIKARTIVKSLPGTSGEPTAKPNCGGAGYWALFDIGSDNLTAFLKQQYVNEFADAGRVGGDLTDFGIGDPTGRLVGVKFIIYNIQDPSGSGVAVKLEYYWNDNADGVTWTKLFETTDNGGWGSHGSTCKGAKDQLITWGGPDIIFEWNSTKQLNYKWLSVREIDPSGSLGANQGGSNSPGPGPATPDEVTTIANAPNVLPGLGGAVFNLSKHVYSVGIDDTGGCIGGISPSPSPPPSPTPPPPAPTPVLVYDQEVNDERRELYDGHLIRGGMHILTGSPLIGQIITEVDVYLNLAGSPTGTASITIRDPSDVVKIVMGTIDVRTLTSTTTLKKFLNTANAYALEADSKILVEYSGGDSSNRIKIGRGNTDFVPNVEYTGYLSSYTDASGSDWSAKLWTSQGSSPSGTMTTTTEVYNVDSTNTPNHLDSSSSDYQRVGEKILAGSSLIGQVITEIDFYLRKSSGATGTATVHIRDSSDNIKETVSPFGTLDVSTLTSSMKLIPFVNNSNTYALQADDRILIEYNSGSSSNYIAQDESNDDTISDAIATRYDGSWHDFSGNESCGKLFATTTVTTPGGGGGGIVGAPVDTVYSVPLTKTDVIQMYRGGRIINGEKAVNNSSALIGANIKQIDFYFSRVGKPTGDLKVLIRNASGTVMSDFGSIDVSTIALSSSDFTLYSFTNLNSTYTIQAGDRITMEYDDSSSNSNNYIRTANDDSGPFDGSNSIKISKDGSSSNSYQTDSKVDVCGNFWI